MAHKGKERNGLKENLEDNSWSPIYGLGRIILLQVAGGRIRSLY